MNEKNQINVLFDELNCCVIIPTYNNAGTIRQVLSGVL